MPNNRKPVCGMNIAAKRTYLIGVSATVVTMIMLVLFFRHFAEENGTIRTWSGRYTELKAAIVEKNEQRGTPDDYGLTFKLRIDPAEKIRNTEYYHSSDILFGFGRTQQQIEEAIDEFNFRLSQYIWLSIDGERLLPSLCHLERNFGMDNGRDIWIRFRLDTTMKNKLIEYKKITLVVNSVFENEDVAEFDWPVKKYL